MAKSKGKHVSDKEQYAAYSAQSRRSKNRQARLARHLKAHPEDGIAIAAAKTDGSQKSNPVTKGNYPEQKYFLYDGAGMKTLVTSVTPNFKATK